MKGLEEDSLSHLFFSFHLRPKEAKEEGKCATAWGEEVAPEELVLESPLPISSSPTSLVGDGVWVWVLRKGKYPASFPSTGLFSQTEVGPAGFREEVSGPCSAGADRRARAGTRLLGESPSPPKSPKLAATSKDARNLHLAL